MSKSATLTGEIRTTRQRQRQRRNRWLIFWLAVIASALIAIQMPIHGAIGCALVDTLLPLVSEWRN